MKHFQNIATLNDLKAAYRKLAMKHHPDHGGSVETMQEINNEYDILFERLKAQHNEAADEEHKTTETAEEFRAIIDALLKLEGLEVELCGSWLWIGGNTKPHKDTLKTIGCRWCVKKGLWSWHHPEEGHKWRKGNSSMADIRNKYGSQTFQADGSYHEYRREEISA